MCVATVAAQTPIGGVGTNKSVYRFIPKDCSRCTVPVLGGTRDGLKEVAQRVCWAKATYPELCLAMERQSGHGFQQCVIHFQIDLAKVGGFRVTLISNRIRSTACMIFVSHLDGGILADLRAQLEDTSDFTGTSPAVSCKDNKQVSGNHSKLKALVLGSVPLSHVLVLGKQIRGFLPLEGVVTGRSQPPFSLQPWP